MRLNGIIIAEKKLIAVINLHVGRYCNEKKNIPVTYIKFQIM